MDGDRVPPGDLEGGVEPDADACGHAPSNAAVEGSGFGPGNHGDGGLPPLDPLAPARKGRGDRLCSSLLHGDVVWHTLKTGPANRMLCPGSRYRVLGSTRHPGYRACVCPSRSRARTDSVSTGSPRRRRYRPLLTRPRHQGRPRFPPATPAVVGDGRPHGMGALCSSQLPGNVALQTLILRLSDVSTGLRGTRYTQSHRAGSWRRAATPMPPAPESPGASFSHRSCA